MAHAAPSVEDPTYYPVEDDLGEHELQTYILELLRPLLARLMSSRAVGAHVGSDQFIYWQQYAPTECVAPDLYVLPGVPQAIAIESWKVWERAGVVPSFALEVVSGNWRKDYLDNLRKYERLGVKELVTFDPFVSGRARIPWRVFRRSADLLLLAEETEAERVHSEVLDCWLRVVGTDDERRIRIGLGPNGDDLFPTEAELERAEKESALAEKESALAEKESALAEAERLSARVRELEAELQRR